LVDGGHVEPVRNVEDQLHVVALAEIDPLRDAQAIGTPLGPNPGVDGYDFGAGGGPGGLGTDSFDALTLSEISELRDIRKDSLTRLHCGAAERLTVDKFQPANGVLNCHTVPEAQLHPPSSC
jgi:hypothetical protein